MSDKNPYDGLKEKLDNINWPAIYLFKFIGPEEKINQIKPLFELGESHTKLSRKGNYVSLTVKMMILNSNQVIDIYLEVNKIKGIIAL